jgi:hypothetical protein
LSHARQDLLAVFSIIQSDPLIMSLCTRRIWNVPLERFKD